MDERLKVVFFVTNYPSANNQVSGIFFKRIAEGLKKTTDADVSVIAPRPFIPMWLFFFLPESMVRKNPPAVEVINKVNVYRPSYLRLPFAHKFKISHYFMYPVIERIIKKIKPDIIDFRMPYPTYPLSRVVTQLGLNQSIPYLYTINGSHGFPNFIDYNLKDYEDMLKKACLIQSVSTEYKSTLEEISKIKCFLTVHPLDTNIVNYIECKEKLRIKFKLLPDRKYLLFVGQLSHEKGVDRLLKIFLEGLYEQFDLILLGDGPLRDSQIHQNIHFLGELDNISVLQYMKSCDLFVFLSRNEGLPNVLKEAGLMEIPVLSSNVGGIPQLLNFGERGYLITSETDSEIYENIKKIFNEKEIMKKKVLNLHNHIIEEFDQTKICKSLFNLYKSNVRN
jgi:teichuronic acid biosynthesis glycosyltransferase TuaC